MSTDKILFGSVGKGAAIVAAAALLGFVFFAAMPTAFAQTADVSGSDQIIIDSAPPVEQVIVVTDQPLSEVTEVVVTEPVTEEVAPAAEEPAIDEAAVEAPAPVDEAPVVEGITVTAEPVQAASAEILPPPPAPLVVSAAEPELSTDKADYHPGETVTIFGKFFQSLQNIVLKVFGGTVEEGTYTESTQNVTADEQGAFTTTYQIDNVFRPSYIVTASDTAGNQLAQTSFTDPPSVGFDLSQCAQNDSKQGQPLGLGNCNWIGSSLGSGNSKLYEGIATEQQLIMTGMAAGTHTLVVGIQTTKGGNHAYDWLVSDATPDSTLNSQQASAADEITLNLNRCGDALGNTAKADCSALVSGAIPTNIVDIPVPDDDFVSADGSTQTRIAAYEALFGDRTVRLYTDGTISGTQSMTLAHMNGKLSGSILGNGGDTGDSYIWYTITWTSTGSNAMLVAGADIALGGDGTGRTWGAGRGAFGITGDPYHFYLIGLDGTGGSKDNQMSGSAIFALPTTPIVTTQVQNASSADITNTSVAVGTVVHDHAIVDTGSASVTIPASSTFTFHLYTTNDCNGTLTDQTGVTVPSGGQTGAANSSTFTPSVGSYSYKVDFISGNAATVTNTTGICEPFTVFNPTGHIIVDKVTISSGDTQSFAFTTTGTGYSGFSLTDAATPNDQTLNAGSYSVAETPVTGWTNTSATCDGNGNTPASITLGAGQTVHCTFTNVKNPQISIASAATNEVGTAHTFTITVGQTGSGGFVGISGLHPTVTFAPSNPGTITDNCATTGTNASGQCTVVINSTSAGVFAAHATAAVVIDGHTFNIATDGVAPNSGNAAKTYVDAKIVLSPLTATNNIGQAHTITATVSKDPGTGYVAAGSVLVTFSLENNTAGAAFVGGNTCTTNGSGVCSVQINSSAPGSVDIHATATVNVGGLDLARVTDSTHGSSGNANKVYQAGKIVVIKQTLPDGAAGSFDFTPSYESIFSLTDGQQNTSGWLAPGASYTVTENPPTGWDFTSATCDKTSTGGNHGLASITVEAGQTTTCTFTNTKRGHIIVDKVTNPAADPQSFSFTTTGTGYTGFSLTDAATPNDQEVAPGAYTVAETVLGGWDSDGGVCDNGETPASLDVGPGETVTCTFTNTKRAHIIVVKDAVPNNAQDFTFANNFSNGNPATFLLDDDSNATLPDTRDFEVIPGSGFSVSETVPTGWKQFSATCGGIGNTPSNITVGAGGSVTCTFVNHKLASIIIVKNTIGGNGTFNFTTTGGDDLPASPSVTTSAGTGSVSYLDIIDPDLTYSITETVPSGWDLTNSSCTGTNTPSSITPNNGETVTCTFTNTKRGHIIVDKVTVPSGDSQSFEFDPSWSTSNFSLTDAATPNDSGALVPGTYSVSEAAVTNWTKTSATCSDGSPVTAIELSAGETVTCTFTNVKNPKISIETTATNEVGTSHTFTVTVGQQGSGGFVGISGNHPTVTFTPSSPGTVTDNCATTGTNASGQCTVVINSSIAGVFTAHATASVTIDGHLFNLATDNTGENSGDAIKTYVEGSIALTPGQATNKVGDNHIITAHVTKNAGLGVTDANGVTVNFSISPGLATFVGPSSCVTAGAGTCTVTITSASTGSNTINATTTFTVGGVSITRATDGTAGPDGTGAASKDYVNARISITPGQATNKVGNPHDFIVTVEQDTGSGFVPVPAGTLANAIVSPATSLDVSDCNDGVDAFGQCTVIINSSVAGVFTITARSTVVVDGVTFKLQTNGTAGNSAPATKTYVDLQIKIDANSTNEVGVDHTFTVTVKKDPGTGLVAAAGETVTSSITGNGSITGGTCTTGTTDASGQCTIIVHSTIIGTGTVSASTTVIVAGVSMTRSLGDGLSGDSAKANKTWVDAQIALSPLTATNPINQAHTITATVTKDPGTGSVPASGVVVTFSLLNNTASAAFVGGVNTCTTNVSGQCSVSINTATPGSVDIHATTTFSVGGVSLTRATGDGLSGDSANANKVYEAGKITIVKDAQPNDLIDFSFTGTAPFGTFLLDDDQGVADIGANGDVDRPNSRVSGFIAPGNYTVTETLPNSFWTFGGVTCVNTGTTNPYTVTPVSGGVTIPLTAGADVTCTFVNIKQSPTRTLGFWQTHTAYTSTVFSTYFSGGMQIGSGTHKGLITNIQSVGASQLFGGFYASIPKTTTGAKRSDVDKARMQLLQQLLAAKLNCAAFGCAASVQAMITTADNAFATGTAAQILASASALDAYNNSGDTIVIGNAGKATPKTSSSWANLLFWDTP